MSLIRTILRTWRIVRRNYAQYFEAGLENGGISPKNGARTALVGRPYRRFSHGWGWDPAYQDRYLSGRSAWGE